MQGAFPSPEVASVDDLGVLAAGRGIAGPVAQHALGGGTGEDAAQQPDSRPMPHPLTRAALARSAGDCSPTVVEHIVEQAGIGRSQPIGLLAGLPLREGCRCAEPPLHILSTALNDVRDEALPVVLAPCRDLQRRVEETEERTEALLDAAVRGSGNQDQVPARVVGHELAQEFVAELLAPPTLPGRPRRAVRLVDHHEVGRMS
jgi:hypothetical protein